MSQKLTSKSTVAEMADFYEKEVKMSPTTHWSLTDEFMNLFEKTNVEINNRIEAISKSDCKKLKIKPFIGTTLYNPFKPCVQDRVYIIPTDHLMHLIMRYRLDIASPEAYKDEIRFKNNPFKY